MITVSDTQYKYAAVLLNGDMTTRELVAHFHVNLDTVGRHTRSLAEKNIIKTVRVARGQKSHKLIVSLDDLVVDPQQRAYRGGVEVISVAEMEYAAELRDSGLTGKALGEKFRERYPHRPDMQSVLAKTRRLRYCR